MKTLTNPRTLDHLDGSHGFGPVSLRFETRVEPPPAHLVSNVHLVPFVGNRCVVVKVDWGERQSWSMPGGTLEPGETWADAAHRELMEEAGARILAMTPFGALRGHSTSTEPWRAHLPHPDFFWLLGWAEVELVSAPLCPSDGEDVLAVECVDVETAVDLFCGCDEAWVGDLYRLAAVLRTNACEAACA